MALQAQQFSTQTDDAELRDRGVKATGPLADDRIIWDYTLMWAFAEDRRGVTLFPSGPFLHYPGLRDWWVEASVD